MKGDEATNNWRKLLEKAFIQLNKENPIPTFKNWKSNGHPFLEKYKDSNTLSFKEIFNQLCNFKDSHENFKFRWRILLVLL